MDRTSMEADHGMLFVFDDDAPRAFWMKNTKIPLDMLFFNAERKLVSVQHRVPPCSPIRVPRIRAERRRATCSSSTAVRRRSWAESGRRAADSSLIAARSRQTPSRKHQRPAQFVRARDAAMIRHEHICFLVDASVLDRYKNTHVRLR